MKLATAACLLAALPALPATARAEDRWILSTEAPVAVPMSAAQRDRFGVGGMPALGLYRSQSSWALIGVRLRAGALSNGGSPPAGMADPTLGGFGSVALALRFRLPDENRSGSGLWTEVAGGFGMTGSDLRPTWEVGVGYGFAVGSVDVGPTIRVLRVESVSGPMDYGAATVGLIGLEVAFLDGPRKHPKLLAAAAPLPPVVEEKKPEPDPEPEEEPAPEPVVEDEPVAASGFVVKNDRIVLEEKVLFDVNRARVKHSGREVLRALVTLFSEHPDWTRLVIEGHADARGKDGWNDWLSQTRADRVKAAMAQLGFAAERVEAVGFGSHHPRDAGTTAAAYQRNRRVEFVIIKDSKEARR